MAHGHGHSVDDYLEVIYFLAFPIGEYRPASGASAIAARVAEMLGVSRASAGEMLKRLEADGLVERGEQKQAIFTPAGIERAQKVVRKHRIIERFLTDFMGYTASESHVQADEMGDTFTDEMIERINERLGFPDRCPHGWPVEPDVEQAENAGLVSLAALEPGTDRRDRAARRARWRPPRLVLRRRLRAGDERGRPRGTACRRAVQGRARRSREVDRREGRARAVRPGLEPSSLTPLSATSAIVRGMRRLLVVDDEPALRESLVLALRTEGFDVTSASDGVAALSAVAGSEPDAIVLDVLMPGASGLEVTRRLRADGRRVPILLLTARDAVGDRVDGLDAGADDYLTKPFALEELLARIRALLRRASPDEVGETLRFADLSLDIGSREVTRGTRSIELTRTEFSLLELFLRNPRQVLPRSLVFDRVWGYDFGPSSNALEVYISYLRRKTEAGDEPRLIHTVRGVGYALRES